MLSSINWKFRKSFCATSTVLYCLFSSPERLAEDICIGFAELTVRGHSELSAECVNLSSSPCPDVSPAISLWLNNRSQDQSNYTLEDFLFIFSLC